MRGVHNTNQKRDRTPLPTNQNNSEKCVIHALEKHMMPPTPSELFKDAAVLDEKLLKNAPTMQGCYEKFIAIKKKAIKAIRDGKVFIIIGPFSVIRNELLKRGWIEKCINEEHNKQSNSYKLLQYAEDGNEFERVILSNLVSEYPADFVFSFGFQGCLRYVHDFALWNRIRIGSAKNFTRKDGLIKCLDEAQFYLLENLAELNTPRAFVLNLDSVQDFEEDYRLTVYRCLIYYLNEMSESDLYVTKKESALDNVVPSSLIYLVCRKLEQMIQVQTEHFDIEMKYAAILIDSDQWRQIFEAYKNLLDKKYKIWVSVDHLQNLKSTVKRIALLSMATWPMTKHDGLRNLWIVKPHNLCGGNGIRILNKYEDIVSIIKSKPNDSINVVQKYIETPLLIHNTKFDIRYFFLITIDANFVRIWEHKSCYLRFSSHQFDLNDLREQVHLTNHTVQQRYHNGPRSEQLPRHNMWHVEQFKEYLETVGKGNMWRETLHPAIKRNLVGAVNVGLEEIELKPNRYQIFGADFLITDDFHVYLLEVNSSPALATNTTIVTEVIFKKVLEDTMKVIFDYSNDQTSSIGGMDLIHKIPIPRCKNTVFGLDVVGRHKFLVRQ